MKFAPLCLCGSLLMTFLWGCSAVTGDQLGSRDRGSDDAGCPVRLRPAGQCGNEEECPYQITMPPLTVQLPKQFRQLEKMAKELQSLKETVNRLKTSCLECRQQQRDDQNLQRDSGEVPPQDRPTADGNNGDGAPGNASAAIGNSISEVAVREMQVRMGRMSASLRNARNQIGTLQGRMGDLSLINMKNVETMVDNKVENISRVVSRLTSTCSNPCPAENSVQHIIAPRDCSDYTVMEKKKNGVFRVTPDPKNRSFEVLCDMESFGGGWTVIQQRQDGHVTFNRTWAEYKKGFGNLTADFWLGNDYIHLLTKAKDMVLRVELEDFENVREYAKYDQFYVANEFLRYRLSVSGYTGTAGNALHFNKHFNHDQRFFTTPDKDNDRYPSGNCGAYYSSGWWFDACMSANLNGKYYHKRYKGVRNGIFWGTWHNMTTEYYPTNYRQAFKSVKMMIRPKSYSP